MLITRYYKRIKTRTTYNTYEGIEFHAKFWSPRQIGVYNSQKWLILLIRYNKVEINIHKRPGRDTRLHTQWRLAGITHSVFHCCVISSAVVSSNVACRLIKSDTVRFAEHRHFCCQGLGHDSTLRAALLDSDRKCKWRNLFCKINVVTRPRTAYKWKKTMFLMGKEMRNH